MGNLAILEAASMALSPMLGNPLERGAKILAQELALTGDEATLFGSGAGCSYTDLLLGATPAPTTPVVTPVGTAGAVTCSYVLVCVSNVGAAPSAVGSTTTGNAILSVTNYNKITLSVYPGFTYQLHRTVAGGSPSSLGLLSTFTVPVTQIPSGAFASVNAVILNFNDTGLGAMPADTPVVNTTGAIQSVAPVFAPTIFSGGVSSNIGGKVVVDGAAGLTLTGIQCLADILVRTSGSGGISDALPTAVALVSAAGPGIRAGAIHELEYRNEGTGTQTITGAAAGITLRAANTNTIATLFSRRFSFIFTNVSLGSEAVEVISGATSAY